jgi:hypothetical protein
MGFMHDWRLSMGEDIKSPTHSYAIQRPQVLYKPPAPKPPPSFMNINIKQDNFLYYPLTIYRPALFKNGKRILETLNDTGHI